MIFAYRLGIYSGLSIAESTVMLIRDVLFYTRCAIAAKHIHASLLYGIMRSPMQFFDTNPLGRIINRFSSDIDLMDMQIPFQISDFIWCSMEVIATLIVISTATPIFLTAVVPIILVFLIIQQLYIATSRQLKRLYSVSKSPIFSHFSETVSGAQVIRAFQVRIFPTYVFYILQEISTYSFLLGYLFLEVLVFVIFTKFPNYGNELHLGHLIGSIRTLEFYFLKLIFDPRLPHF